MYDQQSVVQVPEATPEMQKSLSELGNVFGVDLGNALRTPQGIAVLLADTQPLGLNIQPRVLQANAPFHTLPLYDPIPAAYLGFEKNLDMKDRVLERSFTVSVQHPTIFTKLQIAKVIAVFGDLEATVSIYKEASHEDDDVATCLPVNLNMPTVLKRLTSPLPQPGMRPPPGMQPQPGMRPPPGMQPGMYPPVPPMLLASKDIVTDNPLKLVVRVKVPAGREKVNGFVILVLQAEEQGLTVLYKRFATFATGVALKGYIQGNPKDPSKVIVLSSEAPTFVTKTDKKFFDLPGFNMHLPRLQSHEMLFHVFRMKHTSLLMKMLKIQHELVKPVDPVLEEEYNICLDNHLRNGKTALKGAFEELLDKHEASLAEMNPALKDSELALERLRYAMQLEELQMRSDARGYDLHCVDIRFLDHAAIPQSSNYSLMVVSFLAPGSSESRPAVAVGNIVKFRPVYEDWSQAQLLGVNLGRSYRNTKTIAGLQKATDGINDSLFQLEGVVTNFTLSTEVVVVKLFVPKELLAGNEQQLLCVLESIRYHVRFEFDRAGFYYANQAISKLLGEYADHNAAFSDENKPIRTIVKVSDGVFKTIACDGSTAAINNAHKPVSLAETNKAAQQLIYPGTPPMYEGGLMQHYTVIAENTSLRALLDGTLNEEQAKAVYNIVSLRHATAFLNHRIPPYTIYGPPGTGKTTTVVKAIQALLIYNTKIRILATAPSDAAADVLCIKLIEAETKRCHASPASLDDIIILRLNWWKRTAESVPIALSNYCHHEKAGLEKKSDKKKGIPNQLYGFLDMDELEAAKQKDKLRVVIVSTCGSSGMISNRYGFDYVFIDEASQAGEAESLVPCVQANPEHGVIVLAGDPKQLGVASRSPAIRICSLLDRLLNSQAYSNFNHPCRDSKARAMNPDCLVLGTYLKRNYRSHRDILELPSKLFYNSTLLECGPRNELDSIVNKWRFVENGGVEKVIRTPAIFVGLDSKHAHDLGSPSFFNMGEIQRIESIILSLLISKDITPQVKTSEICIICAFRAQTLEMRKYLRKHNLGNVAVGSPEDYQGQEKRIAIISTVLSSRPRMLSGISESYGFVGHPRRFNVSITRGKALSIVIGNTEFLLGDSNWRNYIEQCDSKGGYYGINRPLLKKNRGTSPPKSPARVLGDGYLDSDERDAKDDMHEGEFRINFDTVWRVML